MNVSVPPGSLDWAKDIALPVAGFIAGFLTSRLTLSKKDRKDFEQANYENTERRIEQHDAAYHAYTQAIAAYSTADKANLANFVEIATMGDRYFYQLNLLSAAMLSGKIDPHVREEVLLAKVRAAVRSTLPQHYETLRAIAAKHGFPYPGEPRREDYGAAYGVIEKFGAGPGWSEGNGGS